MGRAGIFLTRRQIATVRRLVIAGGLPTDSEMQDLRREVDSAYELVSKSFRMGWADYEWNSGLKEGELEKRKITRDML